MLKFLDINHFDDFGDIIVFWVEIQNAPVEIQNKARVIDEENYLENAFGICVQYDLANNEFYIVTDNNCNIYYIDNHGEKHWFEIEINEDFKHLIFKECNQQIMKKAYRLFVNNKWEIANLTEKEVDDICNEIDGTIIINRQYDIKLRNGDIVDLGIIDDILTEDFMKVERTNASNLNSQP